MATIELTEDSFESTISKEGIVIVDAWAPWCGPCRSFAPIYESVSEQHEDVVFGKLDTEAHQSLAAALEIQKIPTLMIFRDQILVYREAGAMPAKALNDLVNQVKDLDMDRVRQDIAEQQRAAEEQA